MKTCARCGDDKPVAEFGPSKSHGDGLYPWCRPCKRAYMRGRYSERSREHDRRVRTRLKYGMSYEEAVDRFGERCGICGSSSARDGRSTRLCIDHDHETGDVRGLLCGPCNRGIGYLADDPERLDAAARYLRGGDVTRS